MQGQPSRTSKTAQSFYWDFMIEGTHYPYKPNHKVVFQIRNNFMYLIYISHYAARNTLVINHSLNNICSRFTDEYNSEGILKTAGFCEIYEPMSSDNFWLKMCVTPPVTADGNFSAAF